MSRRRRFTSVPRRIVRAAVRVLKAFLELNG
ncbi:hypothetical protein ATL42_2404 [Sanguibacter antarcticus]|uniref:Uncharacterized protein n=1 Tax=Sanguibacter antarcticus TaxID=372484 RepID=A0A2A9E6M2_9MICO|nr:hypothetical protein ATL42_2404 [Sanguibacter antarcticus]